MGIDSTHVRRVSCLNILIKGNLHSQLLPCFVTVKAAAHQFLADLKFSELDMQSQNICRKIK